MTLSSTTVKTVYQGDGSTTDFSTVFTFWNSSELEIILVSSSDNETIWTEGTEYTVTGGGGAAGTVSASTTPTDFTPDTGEDLVIKSNVLDIQETSLPAGGIFPSTSVEQELDRTVRRIQQKEEIFERIPTLSAGSTFASSSGILLPDPADNLVLAWSSSDNTKLKNLTPNTSAFLDTPVAVGDGGTGQTSLTDGGVLLGSGASPISAMAVLADGEFIVGNGTTDPVAESGATVRTSLGLGSTDSPTFARLTLDDLQIDANGTLFIGDTANANMTVGLTINQGANDNQILALKSSDVGHAMTALAEADTFASMSKAEATSGGLVVSGYKDADGVAGFALVLEGNLGEAAETTDTTTSNACVHLRGAVTDGGTNRTTLAATGNLLVVEDFTTARLLIKGDGTIHATNVTAGGGDLDGVALDNEDDVGLVRVFERTVHKGMGIAMSKWDEQIRVNENDLKRLGVLSTKGDFYNMQRMNSLLGGAIWQLHTKLMETQNRLALAERKLGALPAN